jgi:hypothetical protein
MLGLRAGRRGWGGGQNHKDILSTEGENRMRIQYTFTMATMVQSERNAAKMNARLRTLFLLDC